VSVLTGVFGIDRIELAEDVVQDSLVEAIKDWPYNGVPSNQTGWLYKVAKNKALTALNREKYRRKYSSAILHNSQSALSDSNLDQSFSDHAIKDDQLRMIFACCHPALPKNSQIALTLKILCGFNIPEIAHAFFTTEETIKKRLVRARQKIKEIQPRFEIPSAQEMKTRVDVVLETIYLLFNEGYSASIGNAVIRFELCDEAIRLGELLLATTIIQDKCNVYAALALMLLNASRFSARIDLEGNILTLQEQDRSLWNKDFMQKVLHI
jgi:RNA polymerase sigma factor (sigma-70 family)